MIDQRDTLRPATHASDRIWPSTLVTQAETRRLRARAGLLIILGVCAVEAIAVLIVLLH